MLVSSVFVIEAVSYFFVRNGQILKNDKMIDKMICDSPLTLQITKKKPTKTKPTKISIS